MDSRLAHTAICPKLKSLISTASSAKTQICLPFVQNAASVMPVASIQKNARCLVRPLPPAKISTKKTNVPLKNRIITTIIQSMHRAVQRSASPINPKNLQDVRTKTHVLNTTQNALLTPLGIAEVRTHAPNANLSRVMTSAPNANLSRATPITMPENPSIATKIATIANLSNAMTSEILANPSIATNLVTKKNPLSVMNTAARKRDLLRRA